MKIFIKFALLFICLKICDSFAKDNFLLSFIVTRMQKAERFEQVDQNNFAGERTGLGLLVESERFDEKVSFETGLIKASRQYTVKDNGHVVAEEVERIHLPLDVKYYLKENLAMGLGLYGSFALSKEERAVENNGPSIESTSAQADESGAIYLLSVHAPVKTSEFILDFRYLEPFEAKNAEQTNNLMISVGVRFEI